MDQRLVAILTQTQLPQDAYRRQAEVDLSNAQTNPDYPLSLGRIAYNRELAVGTRQSALTALAKYVSSNWAETDDEPYLEIAPETKAQLRHGLLQLALAPDERKIKTAASHVVVKMAAVDLPEQWPDLLPTILNVMPTGTEEQLHGALLILHDLVEDNLSEDLFQHVARDVLNACHSVALNVARKMSHRSMAVKIFNRCLTLLEMLKGGNAAQVKAFLSEVLGAWFPFFVGVIQTQLPDVPIMDDQQPAEWYGLIALKVETARALQAIKTTFKSQLLAQSTEFFKATWDELHKLQDVYEKLFVFGNAQSKIEDIDGLCISLDFLVLEEMDLLFNLMSAPPVRAELEAMVAQQGGGVAHNTPWLKGLIDLLVRYSQATLEQNDVWGVDVCLFLCEETSLTANYDPRISAGDIMTRLGEWLNVGALEALYACSKDLFVAGTGESWRPARQEAALYLLNRLVTDFTESERPVPQAVGDVYFDFIKSATSSDNDPLLAARACLTAGALSKSNPQAASLLPHILSLIMSNAPPIIQAACIKSVDGFVRGQKEPLHQGAIMSAIKHWLENQDWEELKESEDLLATVLDTIRVTIDLDITIALRPENDALNMVFMIARHGAQSFQVPEVAIDTFGDILDVIQTPEHYALFCNNAIPLLTGALDIQHLTQDDELAELAAELLETLAEHGFEPLPDGFVAAVFPRLSKLMLSSDDHMILLPGSNAIKHMLRHDHQQVFAWHDEKGESGLGVCLLIISRLLGPTVKDNAASNIGGLAAELVEKAGHERLGPFLPQLLEAVAKRLATAEAQAFIQSLIMVFVRLSQDGAQSVLDFLSGLDIDGQNGLQVVLTKWLQNSVNFAGWDDIRQNIIALSKLFELNDPRLAQIEVDGDLIIPTSDRIMTRSRAKQNPDQYTRISAQLKILKLLVEELVSASGSSAAANVASAAATQAFEDADSDDDDDAWEDEPGIAGLGMTAADLVALGEGDSSRQRDDETEAYIYDFFVRAAKDNIAGFNGLFEMLTDDEKAKLRQLAK